MLDIFRGLFANPFSKIKTDIRSVKDDSKVIRKDFENVGEDMKKAMQEIAKGIPDMSSIPPAPIAKKMPYKNILTIYSKQGTLYEYKVDVENEDVRIFPWKEFYSWYFSRLQSPNYRMVYNNGETMHRREDIISFSVKVEEKK